MSLSFTLVSLGFTGCHSVLPKPGTHGFLGSFPHDSCSLRCARPVGGSIFSPFGEKRPLGFTWIHFFAKKQAFHEVVVCIKSMHFLLMVWRERLGTGQERKKQSSSPIPSGCCIDVG